MIKIAAIGTFSLILNYSTFTKERTVNISFACRGLIAEIGTVTTEIDSPRALKTSKIAPISPLLGWGIKSTKNNRII